MKSQENIFTQWYNRPNVVPILILMVFLVIAIVFGLTSGPILLANFIYIGMVLAIGMWRFNHLPKKKKSNARRFSQYAIGLYMLLFLGMFARENMQLEGLWILLLYGAFSGAVMHYSVSKIFGPLVYGRSWCGWACWTGMIQDRLPFKRSPGRLPGKWGWMRYLHFGLSLALILSLWFAVGYHPSTDFSMDMMLWFLGGNVLYYGLAIGLAYALKDNRAFCKYACPVSVFLKLGSRFSLLKIGADSSQCNDCGACSKLCPMDIDIPKYVLANQRVTSTECILCETCVSTCAMGALGFTFSLDGVKAEEFLQVK